MDFNFSYHLFIVCCCDYYMKSSGENTKEWRIILGRYAVLADVFLDIRLGPISSFSDIKVSVRKILQELKQVLGTDD